MNPTLDAKRVAEYRILGALHPMGFAPKPFYLDDSRKFFEEIVLIIQYVEGTPFSQIGAVSLDSVEKLARLAARIHSLKAESIPYELTSRGRATRVGFLTSEGTLSIFAY